MRPAIHVTPNLAPRQFGKNLLVNVASLLTSVVTGFFMAPFLIKHVGVGGYGLVPLIQGIVSYLLLANIALNSATSRHLSVAIAQGEHERATMIFSTAVWGSAAVSVLVIGAGWIASRTVASLISVPAGMELDARVLFLAATGNAVCVLLSAPLAVSLYYSNRLDKTGMIELRNRLVYVLVAVALVARVAARPAMVGIAALAGAATGLAQTAVWWRRLMPWLNVKLAFDRKTFIEMTWFGGWAIASYAGNLVFLTSDLIIVNRALGPAEAGAYAALLSWPALIRTFATMVSTIFSQPMAFIFAREGKARLFRYALIAVRRTGIIIVVAVVAVGGSAEPLLRLWLGREIGARWPVLVLLVVHLGHNLAGTPFIAALQTVLKVRAIGIASILAGFLEVALAVALIMLTPLGIWGVAISSALMLTVLSAGFIPMYSALEFGQSAREALRILAKAFAVAITGCAIGNAAAIAVGINHWWGLTLHAGLLAAAAAAAAALLFLEPSERMGALATAREHVCAVAARVRKRPLRAPK